MAKDTQINFRATEQTKQELDALVDASVSTSISEYLRHLIHDQYQQISGKVDMKNKRSILIDRFMNLYVGDMEELETLPLDVLESMIDELEQAQSSGELNLETDAGIAKLQEIVERYIN